MPTIRISDEAAALFKSVARPLDDTWVTVMNRSAHFLIAHRDEFLAFDPAAAQNGTASSHNEDPSEHALVAHMKPSARAIYPAVRELAKGLGADVEIGATTGYVRCSVNGRNFAEIAPRANGLTIYMRPESFDIAKGTSSQVHNVLVERPAKANWTLNALVRVTASTDLDGLKQVLQQVYSAMKQ